jgi:hypothetical protein
MNITSRPAPIQRPTPEAFTFKTAFPPPGAPAIVAPKVDAEFCGSPM